MDLGKARSTSEIFFLDPTVKIAPGHVIDETSLELVGPKNLDKEFDEVSDACQLQCCSDPPPRSRLELTTL